MNQLILINTLSCIRNSLFAVLWLVLFPGSRFVARGAPSRIPKNLKVAFRLISVATLDPIF